MTSVLADELEAIAARPDTKQYDLNVLMWAAAQLRVDMTGTASCAFYNGLATEQKADKQKEEE